MRQKRHLAVSAQILTVHLVLAHYVLVQGATAAPPHDADPETTSRPATAAAETKKPAEPEDRNRLDEDQVFKRIGPAYPDTKSNRPKVPVEPVKGDPFRGGGRIYLQDKGDVRLSQRLFGADGLAVATLLEMLAGVYAVDIDGDTQLWLQKVQGDFVVRKGATSQEVIDGIERMINDELHVPARFEWRDVERDVYVLQGEFKGAPIGKVWRRNPDLAAYVVYGKTRPTKEFEPFTGAGQFEIFLKAVGTRIGQPVIADEVELPEGIIGWSICLDEPEKTDWREFPRQHAKNPAEVARHVSAQIGYKLVKAKRTVPVLYLERAKK